MDIYSLYAKSKFLSSQKLREFENSTIAISGGNGFLGRNWISAIAFLNKMYNLNMTIFSIDINESDEKIEDVQYIIQDIRKLTKLEANIDYFIHAASIASPVKYREYPIETIEANVIGSMNVLELARKSKIKKVMILSTSEIYGDPRPEEIPTAEDYFGNVNTMGPRACYDESKRLAETLAWIYSNKFNVDVVVVRPFNVFGPKQEISDGRIIPDIVTALVRNEVFLLRSDGSPTRTFCFVTDFIIATLLLLINGKSGEAYNVGNSYPEICIKDLLSLSKQIIESKFQNREFKIEIEESNDKNYLINNPSRRCPNLEKLKKTIEWEPEIDLEKGLHLTFLSYLGLDE